jgi:Uma2 family endonuclease
MQRLTQVPASAFDHQGFRAWATSDGYPSNIRATFVAGEVLIDTSPEELEGHNKVKTALTLALGRLVEDADLGELYSDGALLTNEAAAVSAEPDLVFVTWGSFEQGRARFVRKSGKPDRYVEIVGVPDLVAQVVSDSSVRKDTKLLRDAYARAGIPEYWLIDARGEDIDFQILHLEQGGYRAPAGAAGGQPSRVLGGKWTLTRGRNRAGRFSYRLARAE